MDMAGCIGETTAYDKKLMLERKEPLSWLKSVSAFANASPEPQSPGTGRFERRQG